MHQIFPKIKTKPVKNMKKLYITMLAVLFASAHCMADDVVTFEEFEVNANGYQNDFGDDACFEAGGFTFNCNYFPEWYYWSGFAISSRTETSFADYTIDQFNSCVGSGVNGSQKFVIAYPQGETIDVDAPEGRQISGFYVTNNAWTVEAILNGDGMTPGGFTTGDYLTLWIIGNHPDETADTLYYYLADYRSENVEEHYYVNDWQWVDLTALGTVESITFRMDSSRKNDWGVTTPTYFCMDDFNGVAPATTGVATFEEMALNPDSYYNGAGAEGIEVMNSWGMTCIQSTFRSGGYDFTTVYDPTYGSWSGIGVSNDTGNTYAALSDQYRNCVGGGYDGSSNYAVVYPSAFNEAIVMTNGPETISGMYITNSAWNVQAYTEGDSMTPGAFAAGDWCKLTITGEHADGTTTNQEVYLADYRSENPANHYYINQWQWIDLSALGEVAKIWFGVSSSRNNDWGMTTPGYFCMDNFNGEPDATVGISCPRTPQIATTTDNTIYTLQGVKVEGPLKPGVYVKNGHKYVVK